MIFLILEHARKMLKVYYICHDDLLFKSVSIRLLSTNTECVTD